MPDSFLNRRTKIPTGTLFWESLQRELTYLPFTAAFLGFWLYPDQPATWIVAPLLLTLSAGSFIYDFFVGTGLRQKLERRRLAALARQRQAMIDQLRLKLTEGDAQSLDAILTMQQLLEKKVVEKQGTLEMTGTFLHTYQDLVGGLADAGLDALRSKAELTETVAELRRLGAKKEAAELSAKANVLEGRVQQVRDRLSETLAQIAVMDRGTMSHSLEALSQSLEEQLELAAELSGIELPEDTRDALAEAGTIPVSEPPAPEPRQTSRRRKRKRT